LHIRVNGKRENTTMAKKKKAKAKKKKKH